MQFLLKTNNIDLILIININTNDFINKKIKVFHRYVKFICTGRFLVQYDIYSEGCLPTPFP